MKTRRLRSALAALVAAWLLAQALGHFHAVLHARPPGQGSAVDALSKAFHPQDPARSDDGLCRLYAHLALGDLAAGAAPAMQPDGMGVVPAAVTVASVDAAPRRGFQARGPPVLG